MYLKCACSPLLKHYLGGRLQTGEKYIMIKYISYSLYFLFSIASISSVSFDQERLKSFRSQSWTF